MKKKGSQKPLIFIEADEGTIIMGYESENLTANRESAN